MADDNAQSIGISVGGDVSLEDIRNLGHGSHFFGGVNSGESVAASSSNAMTNNVYGINHRQTPLPVPMNKDRYGYTFFTRPQLNMQSDNLRNVRRFIPLLTEVDLSYHRMIRCLLDPRQMTGYGLDATDMVQPINCDLVDNMNPFISVMTNSLTSISGWPDIRVPTFSSREGPYKEGWSIADGVTVDYTTYDVTATFRNSRGDPISSLLSFWEHYMFHVFEDTLVPYADMIAENEIDYNTRIYRLVMDPTNRLVQRICASGASFPIALSVGQNYDYDATKPYNDSTAEITVPFRCMGFIEQDDILIRAFNDTVAAFNPSMAEDRRDGDMVKLPYELLSLFNNRGYPRIEPITRELEWWVFAKMYNDRMTAFKDINKALDDAMGLALVNI